MAIRRQSAIELLVRKRQLFHEVRSVHSAVAMLDDGKTTDGPSLVERPAEQPTLPRSLVLENLSGSSPSDRTKGADQPPWPIDRLRFEFAAATISLRETEQWKVDTLVVFDELGSGAVRVFLGEKLVGNGELVDLDGEIAIQVVDLVESADKKAA